jgi:hypothetical protein
LANETFLLASSTLATASNLKGIILMKKEIPIIIEIDINEKFCGLDCEYLNMRDVGGFNETDIQPYCDMVQCQLEEENTKAKRCEECLGFEIN